MNIQNNQILKNYMLDRKYTECISIIKNKIVSFIIAQIKFYDNSFEFTTVSDLISASRIYLKDTTIASKLQIALIQNTELEQLQDLLSICEEYNIT